MPETPTKVELAKPAAGHLAKNRTCHGSVPASIRFGTRDREFLLAVPVGYRHLLAFSKGGALPFAMSTG